MTAKRAFTLVELLVVITIVGLLVTIIAPAIWAVQRTAYRASCGNNVKEITRGLIAYAGDTTLHRGVDLQTLPTISGLTSNWANLRTGNAGALSLLIRTNFVGEKLFLCPEAKRTINAKEMVSGDANFSSDTYCYSYLSQVPFTDSNNANCDGNATDVTAANPSLVIFADRNPRFDPNSMTPNTNENGKNSKNHNRDGQNVGRLDASVSWTTTTTVPKAGNYTDSNTTTDDIYQPDNNGNDLQGKRGGLNDSFLIP